MRVLVTGATGWIGSAVVPELRQHGHDVAGLARSDASARALTETGATVVRGSLDDLHGLRAAAVQADGVIHLAFKHDIAFSGDFAGAAAADREAIATFGQAMRDSDKPLVIASGLAGHPPGAHVTEDDPPDLSSPAGVRMRAEQQLLDLSGDGVRSASVRLAPSVHGDGDPNFVAELVRIARERGVSGYVGDGANRWPAVHRDDAAALFRLALEGAPAGSVLHGAAEEGVALKSIAEVIGHHLDLPTASVAVDEAAEHFGWLATFVAIDVCASSTKTRERIGWAPARPGLLEDLDQGHYFRAAA